MYTGMLHTHTLCVTLFLILLLVKVFKMATRGPESLVNLNRWTKIPNIIISVIMLATGIYLMIKSPEGTQPYVLVKLGLVIAAIPLGIIGLKRGKVALGALSVLLLVGTMTLAYTKPEFLRNVDGDPIVVEGEGGAELTAELKKGREIYNQKCFRCHGKEGDAGASGAKDLKVSKISDEEITKMVREGKGMMEGYPELSDAEMKSVVAYVKYLRK